MVSQKYLDTCLGCFKLAVSMSLRTGYAWKIARSQTLRSEATPASHCLGDYSHFLPCSVRCVWRKVYKGKCVHVQVKGHNDVWEKCIGVCDMNTVLRILVSDTQYEGIYYMPSWQRLAFCQAVFLSAVRWSLYGVKVHFWHGAGHVKQLWPWALQFEHWILQSLIFLTLTDSRCSILFCFSIIWRRAVSPWWFDDWKKMFVITFFSSACWLKGWIEPCIVINSPT